MTNESADAGKKLVVRVAAIAISISILTIITFNILQGSERLPQQVVRFGFTLAICYFLVRGKPWARWVSIALFLLAGIGSVAGAVGLFGASAAAWALLAMGGAYLYCAGVLLASASAKAFFKHTPVRTPETVGT